MKRLVFSAADMKRVVEHSIAAPEQKQFMSDYKNGEAVYSTPTEPSIILVKDQGVYVMSAGTPGDPLDPNQDMSDKYWRHFVVYAEGYEPGKVDHDTRWERQQALSGDDFAETLPWAKNIKEAIDKGAKKVVIKFGARNIGLEFR